MKIRNLFLLIVPTMLIMSIQIASASFSGTVNVDTSIAGEWSYTIFNTEPPSGPDHIYSFSVAFTAPDTFVCATPNGWTYDLSTYLVTWTSDDLPFDVAPGGSLSGFSLCSTTGTSMEAGYGLGSWDHDQDIPGDTATGSTLAPGVVDPPTVPEPAFYQLGSLLALGGLGVLRLRKRA
jgi:hypothetical protein